MMPQDAGYPDPANNPARRRDRTPNPIAGRIEPTQPPRDDRAASRPVRPAPTRCAAQGALRRRWMSAVRLGGTLAGITAVAVVVPAWRRSTTAFAQFRVSLDRAEALGDDTSMPAIAFSTYTQDARPHSSRSRPVIMAALQAR